MRKMYRNGLYTIQSSVSPDKFQYILLENTDSETLQIGNI